MLGLRLEISWDAAYAALWAIAEDDWRLRGETRQRSIGRLASDVPASDGSSAEWEIRMVPGTADDRIQRLQEQLSQALAAKDKDAEIDILLQIGETAVDESPQLAFSHFKLAEKVIRRSGKLDRLHEAIGGQGRAFRREKRFDEAIERYQAAEEAARAAGNTLVQVRWMLRRASAHRTRDELDQAVGIVDQADELLHPKPADDKVSVLQLIGPVNFFDKGQVSTFAELEGQIGLNLVRSGDEQGAEDHYRSALYYAEGAQDWSAVNTWASNVGNACARRGRYDQAVKNYERALAAAGKCASGGGVLNAAMQLADCLSAAYRHEEAVDRLCALAAEQSDERLYIALLYHALELCDEGMCAAKAIDTAQAIESRLAGKPGVGPDFLERVRSMRAKFQDLAAQGPVPSDGPPVLDLLLPEFMTRSEGSGDPERALQAANLVCDVRLAVALAGGKHWKRLIGGDLLKTAGLDHRVVFDTLHMLLDARRIDEALELLQRYKAPTYCVPELLRFHVDGALSPEATAFVDAALELVQRVDGLAAPAPRDFVRPANDLRRAGERLREAGEALREIDPTLLARLGGLVRRDELIDALPYQGGVGIVDFVVGAKGTVGVVLGRGDNGVIALPIVAASFTAEHAKQLLDLYGAANLSQQLGGAHTKALLQMGKVLHDHLLCGLARELSKGGITQLILIPDPLTRNVPLHLSFACGKEFHIPSIDTSDANFICEVMPVEYAPCLQAVAASQVYVRPRAIKRIAAFADPNGDLPGVRESMEQFGRDAPDASLFRLASGSAATKAAVMAEMPEADVVMFGTHGEFAPSDLERTGLVLSGEPWTAADMLQMKDLKKRALILLVACKAGAINVTPDDRSAWGIPGALLSAGASAVLANLWPVEDVTSNYLLERFLVHLSYRGYRPAAALFRAVRDLRRVTRDDALAYCRQCLERQRQAKAPASVLIGTRSILQWVEDCEDPHPFAHPFFWGATAIFGSGWHLPAGASVGSPLVLSQNTLQLGNADRLLNELKPRQAIDLARAVAARSDGATRGHAYTTMAWARLLAADLGTWRRAHREAIRLLNLAERIAASEEDENLLKRVQWMRERMEKKDVVENDD